MTGGVTIGWWQLAFIVGGAAILAALAAMALLRRPAAPAPGPAAAASPPPDAALTAGLIGAFDLAEGAPAVRSHIVQTLRSAGVVQLPSADGAPFDPAAHLAVGTDRADQQSAGLVARTVRPGWVQGGVVLRPAEVIVWKT